MDVIGLGAWCDYDDAAHTHSNPAVHFSVAQFAVLSDGRRLSLHAGSDRGFTTSSRVAGGPPPADAWAGLTLANIEANVRNTVLPDDDSSGEEHPGSCVESGSRAGLNRVSRTGPRPRRRTPAARP